MKKIISAILALVMCVSMMGGAAALVVDEDTGAVTYTFGTTALASANGLEKVDKNTVAEWWSYTKEINAMVRMVTGPGNHGWYYFDHTYVGLDDGETETAHMFQLNAGDIKIATSKSGYYAVESISGALELVPPSEAGFYKVSYVTDKKSGVAGYMGTVDDSNEKNATNYINDNCFVGNVEKTSGDFEKLIFNDASTHLVYASHVTNADAVKLYSITLTPVSGDLTVSLDSDDTNFYVGDTATATAYVGTASVANSFVEWVSSNPRAVTVDGTGKLTAVGGGRSDIHAYFYDAEGNYKRATKRVRVYQPEYVEAFGEDAYTKTSATVSPSATASVAALDGSKLEATIEEPVYDEETGTYSVSAPETIGDYNFRYWIKGLEPKKQIVSLDRNITAYTPHNGPNYLIAVYDKAETTSAETEYYNANGQKLENGDTLPYMAGYGQAKGWIDHKNGVKEAVYGEPNTFTITVDDACSEESKVLKPKYGELVECETAEVSGKTFIGWFKTVNEKEELVCTDMNYSFYAWENCTVTARHLGVVNELVKPSDMIARRILLGTFDIGNGEQAVMAEFIGFDNAVERGITIGTKDYAMTQKDASQFVIINDANPTAAISGYAILANGTKYIYTYTATAPETAE